MGDILVANARSLRRVMARLRSVVRRAVTSNSDSSGKLQTLQTQSLADNVADDVEHFEAHGFTSRPPVGSEGLMMHVGADTAHAIGINFSDRNIRLKDLDKGEVAMYHDTGAKIVMRTDGSIEVFPTSGKKVHLGGSGGLDVARLTDEITLQSMLTLQTAMNTWVPVAMDGGAALKTALAAFLALPNVEKGSITGAGDGSEST